MSDTDRLAGQTDAQMWARVFTGMVKENPHIATDPNTMLGWFANAIAAGAGSASRPLPALDDRERAVLSDYARLRARSLYQSYGTAHVYERWMQIAEQLRGE